MAEHGAPTLIDDLALDRQEWKHALDDIYRQVIGTVVPESSFFGFAYSRAIGLNDICFHVCFFLINSDSK